MERDQVYLYLYLTVYGNESEIQKVGDETDICSISEDQLKSFRLTQQYKLYVSC
jgi:hypothetical protein